MASSLESLLSSYGRPALVNSVLPALLDAISEIGTLLRESQNVTLAGTNNVFGDGQLNVDVSTENAMRKALAKCPSVLTASSEEDPIERPASDSQTKDAATTSEQYTVAFDPLDGSSIIAPNWTVGTIIGIWDGASALHQNPTEKQIASVLGVHGPRTTAVVALRIPGTKPILFELGINNGSQDYEIVRSDVKLAAPPFKTRYFAPANLRAAGEYEPYMRLITYFIEEKYTLRYIGGLVPDLVHALVKGHGVYVSPVTDKHKAKLRRLYELLPIALIMECAGGKAIDSATGEDILSRPLGDCNETGGLICGTAEDVDIVKKMLLS
ncbi:fructose-1-6-bisphosphatase [Penicillium angulare]|uniref:Fructose-1-6-bisphosphatase n=1 Tax=Penicillium angulare TaxID=116970 RepID=A0A9W9FXT2_9EURO|nr:fructose-1-6-bisphosphatase [Penicillium angulare]